MRREKRGATMTLNQCPVGGRAKVTAVDGGGPLRLRLLDMGLVPGTTVTVVKTAPLGDPLQVFLRGYELMLRRDDARRIRVEREESA